MEWDLGSVVAGAVCAGVVLLAALFALRLDETLRRVRRRKRQMPNRDLDDERSRMVDARVRWMTAKNKLTAARRT